MKSNIRSFNLLLVLSLLLVSCNKKEEIKYEELKTFTENNYVNAIIEIPAGTNSKVEFNKKTKLFEIDQRKGKNRVIDFLPYLGNYGFIPGTYSDPNKGGDGDGLDILVLSESIPTGAVVKTIPIGVLKLIDNGEQDYKIIAVPEDTDKRIIKATTFDEFKKEYPAILNIIEQWFRNYDKEETAVIKGWNDENAAMNLIKNK